MKSVMTHQFSQVPAAEIPRSSFDRSHGFKTTFDAGYLVPCFVDEALPGDTFNLDATFFARLATPISPTMDNLRLETFFFAVPYRLVWDNWEKFHGARKNPADSIDFLIPQMTSPGGGYANESLHDYLGLPTGVAGIAHSSLFHRAYNLIWNEWFRDENLQNSVVVDLDDGPDNPADYVLLRRGKRHDYFTSCLPWPQKGTAISLPLGASAPVVGDGKNITLWNGSTRTGLIGSNASGYLVGCANDADKNIGAAGVGPGSTTQVAWGLPTASSGGSSHIIADLSGATASTINELREAFQLQKLMERDARGGTRYVELIKSHFGVTSPDFRLQRPEYLGGGSTPVQISQVAKTSSTDGTSPQGNLAGYGVCQASGHRWVKSFTEHCIIIGLVNVRADLTYQQGLNRMFSRSTRYDFYYPALANLGEQAVLSKELYCDGTAGDSDVFGYQERWAEYRYKPSLITGKFRSNDAGSLDVWHYAQDFAARPVLNSTFIVDSPPIDRTIAVPSEPHFLLDSYFGYRCARPMPLYSVPGLIDHF